MQYYIFIVCFRNHLYWVMINFAWIKYRVSIKYCVFFRFFKNIPDSGLSLFSLGVSVCVHTSGSAAEFRKFTKLYGKIQYFMNPLPTGCSGNIVLLEGWEILLESGYFIKSRQSEERLMLQPCSCSTNVDVVA